MLERYSYLFSLFGELATIYFFWYNFSFYGLFWEPSIVSFSDYCEPLNAVSRNSANHRDSVLGNCEPLSVLGNCEPWLRQAFF